MKFILITFLFFNVFLNKLYSDQLIRKVAGYSEVEKHTLSDNTSISHYKNKGTWTDNKGNYGTETCKGTIVINPEGTIIDYLLFCNGRDHKGYTYTAQLQRSSNMDAGTGYYLYIDGTGTWKRLIGKKCNYAISYLGDAYFTTDKCNIKN